jgi:hypothetical protein
VRWYRAIAISMGKAYMYDKMYFCRNSSTYLGTRSPDSPVSINNTPMTQHWNINSTHYIGQE